MFNKIVPNTVTYLLFALKMLNYKPIVYINKYAINILYRSILNY